MWLSRFVFLTVCCLVIVKCLPQSDQNFGGPQAFGSERLGSKGTGSSFGQYESQDSKFNVNNEGSTFGRPIGESNFNNRESETRPGSSGRPSNNRENQHSTGSRPNNQEVAGSGHAIHREENRPSSSRPGSSGDTSFGRPTGGSSHTTDNREDENRPFGSKPSSGGDNSFGRPTGGSGHITDNRETENRPFGSRPSSSGENSFGRPVGSITDHREGENRPSASRPSGSGESSYGRPTGGSSHTTDHREGENRPSGSGSSENSFGRPESSHRPINQEHSLGGTTQKPGSHQNTGDSSSGINSPGTDSNKENEKNNKDKNKDKDNKDDGKEEEEDVCFNYLGCFKMGKPWKTALRPIGAPHGPEKIQTTIQFYSRDNLERPKYIPLYPQVEMGEARFDPSKITAMIIHGFSNSGNATWLKEMKDVYLGKVDANVMIVDWGKGAQLLNYFQVAGNTRVVGKQLGVFIKFLIDKYGADPGKFHLIGHSLGAQISSYVGKEVQGIARLTAMDPAQPAFEGFDKEIRLDKNDAEFVDVIHTDARPFIPTLGFGMIAPHGHVDFYMNGGFDQPGCVPPSKKDIPSVKNVLDLAKFPVEVIARTVACPHARAYEYLIEAFNETENCIFWGHKADAKNVFKSVTNTLTQGLLKKFTALSPTCHKEDCIPLGFATKKSPLRGVFVVTTNGKMPYCISEPGIPPETPPQERKHDSFIQKIGRKTRVIN